MLWRRKVLRMFEKQLNIGIIGTGFMGKAHAFAYRSALAAFPDIPVPVLRMIADVNADSAAKAAHQYGFEKSSGDWRDLINDQTIDVVSITTPNTLHKEMAVSYTHLTLPTIYS